MNTLSRKPEGYDEEQRTRASFCEVLVPADASSEALIALTRSLVDALPVSPDTLASPPTVTATRRVMPRSSAGAGASSPSTSVRETAGCRTLRRACATRRGSRSWALRLPSHSKRSAAPELRYDVAKLRDDDDLAAAPRAAWLRRARFYRNRLELGSIVDVAEP